MEKELEKTIQDIKDLKIQGNTNIAKAAVKALLNYITHTKVHNFEVFKQKIKYYAFALAEARPNEPIAYNAMTYILAHIDECENQQELRVKMIDKIEQFFKYIDESYEVIRTNAMMILKNYSRFITHCNSSLVRDTLIGINKVKKIRVFQSETRPKFQGRITAEKLTQNSVHVIHYVDSFISSIVLDNRYENPEVAIVGSDGITLNGDLVNKIGTYSLALACYEANIPFFVVTQTMKLDPRSKDLEKFLIELRSPDEVWDYTHDNIHIINPAFDLVPAKYITGGYITEKGLIKPEDIKDLI